MFAQTKDDNKETKEKTNGSLFENKGSTGAPSLFENKDKKQENSLFMPTMSLKKEASTYGTKDD